MAPLIPIYIVLAIIGFALAIAATTTAIAMVEQTNPIGTFTQSFTSWRSCTKAETAAGTNTDCNNIRDNAGCLKDLFGAIQAFNILTIIFFFFAIVVGLLSLAALILGRTAKFAMLLLALLTTIFALIAWPMMVSLWTNDCRGFAIKDVAGSKVGPAAILAIIAFVLALLATIVALLIPVVVVVSEPVAPVVVPAGAVATAHPITQPQPAPTAAREPIAA